MRTALTILLGAALLTLPAMAGGFTGPSKGKHATMTGEEIDKAWETQSFEENGKQFKIVGYEDKEPEADEALLKKYWVTALKGQKEGDGRWLFIATDDVDTKKKGKLKSHRTANMIRFVVELVPSPSKLRRSFRR